MATATAKKRKTSKAIDLREDLALGLAPLSNGQKRVDRAKKVIHGVKMIAGTSKNSHGVDDVQGTDYLYETLLEARPLYEGIKANANHPPRETPNQERSVYDRLGKFLNVRVERSKENPELGEMYGDLHLVPSHGLTESILDAAENETLNDCYALSHNARGRGEVRNSRYVITQITEARNVDVVADGGGTRSLYESRETMADKKTTLGKVILESKIDAKLPSGKTVKAWLLEMDDLMGAEVPAEPEGDHKDDLVAAVAKLLKSSDAADHELVAKITALLHPEKASDLEETESEEDKDDKDKMSDMKESREEAKALLSTFGLKNDGPILEALATVPKLKDKLAFINEIKGTAAKTTTTKAPPGGPRSDGKTDTTLQEGKKISTDDLLSMPLS